MGLKTLDSDSGQSNIDFLFGVGVFLVTFLYVATFIPGLFVPYQPGAIDLSSVAYRTSAILAEDPGWYRNDTANGTAWEEDSDVINHLSRVGLADDKDHPNVLSIGKVNKLNELIVSDASNYDKFRHSMGLDGSVIYDFNLVVGMDDTMSGTYKELVNVQSPNAKSRNIQSIDRTIMVDTGEQLFVDCDHPAEMANPKNSELFVNVSNASRDRDLIIRIYNFSTTSNILFYDVMAGTSVGAMSLEMDAWPVPHHYNVTLNGVPQSSTGFMFTQGDIVEITIHRSTFIDYPVTTYIGIKADSAAFPGRMIYYKGDPVFKLKKACYPGVMKLEVW